MIRRLVLVSTLAGLGLVGMLGLSRGGAQPAAVAKAAFPAPDRVFVMRDGFRLPARVWRPPAGIAARGVMLAVHGFTDSRDAWALPAPGFAAAGYVVVAPDQRGFGATADRGRWAGQDVMVGDIAELAGRLRAENPGLRLVIIAESMGAAETMVLAARSPATADAYVLISPAVWGPAQLAVPLRVALWGADLLAPGWKLSGSEVPLDIAASDNQAALLAMFHDPLTLRGADVAMLAGLVKLMGAAQDSAAHLPSNTLLLAGRRDQIVPPPAMAAAWAKLPAGVRRGLYLNGFHLLLRDLDRALVEADVLAWLADPAAWLPSGADINAAAWRADHAWQEGAIALPAQALDGAGQRRVWPY
jgi:alpha-beta hydrolase superfamily lysophospholipase